MPTLRSQNIALEAGLLANQILQEQSAGVEHFNSTAAVTDAFSTPFFRAIRREGYKSKLKGDCVVLRGCKRCRKHYAGTYLLNGQEVDLCPLCDRV